MSWNIVYDDSGVLIQVSRSSIDWHVSFDKDGAPNKEYKGTINGFEDKDSFWVAKHLRVKHRNGDGSVEVEQT